MRNLIKSMAIAATVAVVAVANVSVVHAFDRAEYTADGKPQFNTYTSVEGWGNEKDFFRTGTVDNKFADAVNETEACEGEVKLFVYVHNGAPEELNGTNNDGTGVAKDAKVKVTVPTVTDNKQKLTAVISASNAASVTDDAFINCGSEKIKVEYVKDSAEIVSLQQAKRGLSNAIVDGGALIGTEMYEGVVPGCWEFRNYVTLKVKVTKVPEVPEVPETPETPEKPKEEPKKPVEKPTVLPSTGAGSIASIFGLTTVAGAAAHYAVASRRRK